MPQETFGLGTDQGEQALNPEQLEVISKYREERSLIMDEFPELKGGLEGGGLN